MALLKNLYCLFKDSRKPMVFCVALWVSSCAVYAQTPTEQEVKAVYLYNFVNFVEWPGHAFGKSSDPLVIGIAGADAYLNLLKELVRGETYKGRSIDVRSVDKVEEAGACHILFMDNHCKMTRELISETQGKPILTISESSDFMQQGGMVRFFIEANRVKIEINPTRSSDHALSISAKLLRLSKLYNEQ